MLNKYQSFKSISKMYNGIIHWNLEIIDYTGLYSDELLHSH